MVLVLGIAGGVIAILLLAFSWSVARKVGAKRERLDKQGNENAARMGTYVEPVEPVIHLNRKDPES